VRIYSKSVYVNNTEKIKACVKKYQAENPEKAKDYQAKYYVENSEKIKTRHAKYRASNTENMRAYQTKYYAENLEKRRVYSKKYYMENPEKIKINNHNRRAREYGSGGKLSQGLFEKLFNLQKGKCPVCKIALSNVKPRSPMDHITSLFNGGANEDWNIQILCQPCNRQKSAKDPTDFMQERGFLL
jgi:5-methylcytosine-specific restriction endonuclease McrA